MKRSQLPPHWQLLNRHERRAPEWLAERYKKKLFLAAARAYFCRGCYPEPIYGLLKSIDVEPLSQHFIGKAVVSFNAVPFSGSLYQTYSWTNIIYLTPSQLKREIVSGLVNAVQDKQKRKLAATCAALRQRKRDAVRA